MRVEVLDENGAVVAAEQTVSENISPSGATLFTTLNIDQGRFIRLTSEQYKITIHAAGNAVCSLSGKEADGLTVTFDDGTVTEQHLSWKSFRQLVAMKTAQNPPKSASKPAIAPAQPATPANGHGR